MCGRASQAEIKAYQNKIYEWLYPKEFVPRRNLRPTEPACDEQKRPRYSFATFTCEPNDFMKPLHEKAMPVILNGIDEQKLWLLDGDVEILRPFEGEMQFEQLPDTLEHLYPEENQKYA